MSENEQSVSEDGLENALNDLLKAADTSATVETLQKSDPMHGKQSDSEMDGLKISTSGFSDEDGHQGGGMAGRSDIGSLSNGNAWETKMMIAKMIQSGIVTPGPNFVGFADGEYDEEEDEEVEMNGAAGGGFFDHTRPSPRDGAAKSEDEGDLMKSLMADQDIADGVDASDFMEALTVRSSAAIDGLAKSMHQRDARQGKMNAATARAVYEMGTLVKSQTAVIGELGKRLGMVEAQPAPARGATSLEGAKALHKSAGDQTGDKYESLNKSQVSGVLTYMNLEKGITEIGGERTATLATYAEAGNIITPGTLGEVRRFLHTHPGDAERALSYS